jgi:aqualysin 1
LSEAQALALSLNPQIEYIEEDAIVEGAAVQNSPTWGLDRIDQRDLPLNASYSYANAGTGVNVYVVDGGIRYTHREFGGRAALGYDYVVGGTGLDCNGHGTHVAGTIGGATYGVAKNAKLWSVRVLDCANQGTVARIVAGVDWVTANHVKPAVANLSFATGLGNSTMDLAVSNSIAAGVTYVVAAGNNSGDAGLRSPARVAEAITVAATDQNDNQASFSNFGAAVDVYAPGVDIVSTWSTADEATNIRSGTSFAAPFVAGIAARYLSGNPQATPASVSQAITSNATAGKIANVGAGSPNLLLYRPNSKIAFETKRDGNYEVYTVNPDGSELRNLTNTSPTWEGNAAYSPDGTKIAFGGDLDDIYWQIYVMNSDGTGIRRLTNTFGTADNWEPTWSPDGTKIAFTSTRDGDGEEIWVMNADGSNQVKVTDIPGSQNLQPDWSPTGDKIAFLTNRDYVYNFELYVMNADGTNQTRITNNTHLPGANNDYYPEWSPDGTKIAFVYDGGNVAHTDQIHVMNADGSGRVNLSNNAAYEYNPAWSPDGSKIVFMSNRDGNFELYVMNADGSNQTRLTHNLGNGIDPNTANDYFPDWQAL